MPNGDFAERDKPVKDMLARIAHLERRNDELNRELLRLSKELGALRLANRIRQEGQPCTGTDS